MPRLILLLVLASGLPALALAADTPYGEYSDQQLNALAAEWDSLDRHQRRALLTEMKLRMARKGADQSVLHIRTERRYGRLIRKSDGRVIHIETQVVHVRPVKPEDLKARQGFGIGFEHRVARQKERLVAAPAGTAPAATAPAEPAPSPQSLPAPPEPSLNGVLDSLAPSTQAPVLNRLPIYPASDPKH
ncbi:MAG TPA: hypothetical protein VF210_09180 [Pseudomonadales bacterium]